MCDAVHFGDHVLYGGHTSDDPDFKRYRCQYVGPSPGLMVSMPLTHISLGPFSNCCSMHRVPNGIWKRTELKDDFTQTEIPRKDSRVL
jgi:hypothetical protein